MQTQLMFSPLPSPKSRLTLSLAAWGTQFLMVALFLVITSLMPEVMPAVVRELPINLVPYDPPAPVVAHFTPQRIQMVAPVLEARLIVPRPVQRVVASTPVEEVATPKLEVKSLAPKITANPVIPRAVQVGGFGDPNGVPTHTGRAQVNINASGSFSAAPGSGSGGKIAGSVVASSGFGTTAQGGTPARHGTVTQSGFDSQAPVVARTVSLAVEPKVAPVTIMSKPTPLYTAEGRQMKIEGAVRLQVRFTADGKVVVLSVLNGLGHGLDEQAVAAAQRIKFKPAQREGQSTDSTVVLSVVFQLAS